MLKFGKVTGTGVSWDKKNNPYPIVKVESQSEDGRVVECNIVSTHRDLVPSYASGDLVAFLEETSGVACIVGHIVTTYSPGSLKQIARVGDSVVCPAGGGQIVSGSDNLRLRFPAS